MDDRLESDADIDAGLRATFAPNRTTVTRVTQGALQSKRRQLVRFLPAVAVVAVAFVAVVALVVFRSSSVEARPSVRLTAAGSVAVASSPAGEIWVTNRIESPPQGGSLVVVQRSGGE